MGKSTVNVPFPVAMLNYQRDPEGIFNGAAIRHGVGNFPP